MSSRHQSTSRRTIEPNVLVIFPDTDDRAEDYEWIGGRICNGISNEFPRILFRPESRDPDDLYLIPASLSCASSLQLLTKAQQAKNDFHYPPGHGESMLALVPKKGRSGHDKVVKGMIYDIKDRGFEMNNETHFKVDCVLSPGNQPKCYAGFFGEVAISQSLTNKVTIIPNVVYVGYVNPKILITNNNCKESGANTEILFQPELVEIAYVKPLEEVDDFTYVNGIKTRSQYLKWNHHFSLLNSCPWNINHIMKVGEHQGERQYTIQKPPARKLRQVVLWYFSGNIVVRCNVPKTLVKITEGMERAHANMNHIMAKSLELRDGECLLATIIYSEFCDSYYVEKYFMITDSKKNYIRVPPPGQRKLEKRITLHGFEKLHEYSVRVQESTQFKGFFVCEPLRNCLIADPKNLLRNVVLEEHQGKGEFPLPVWIRLEKNNNDRLAQFSITELNRESGEYSPKEKMMDYPNISGCGILVCLATGTVFSKDHPQKNIRLDPLDKYEVQLGHFFYFNAAYWPEKSLYLIGNFQPISEDIMQPIPTFYFDNRLLFEEEFDCYCPQASETHYGQTFGPISDPLILITARARMTKIEWPKKAIGYVGYNADFEPGLNSKMMLFNELIDEEAEEITSEIMLIQGENNYKKCRCYDLWHLVHDIRSKTQGKKGMMNEELWQRLHTLEKNIQPMIEEMDE